MKISGFTLIELMIVVAAIAILAAIAYPSYQEQIRQGRRTDAHNMLLRIASRQEQAFTQRNTYTASWAELGYTSAAQSENDYYSATVALTNGGLGYLLTATPQNEQAGDPCGNFTLDQLGNRDFTGTGVKCPW